jgi:hypothetical protein
MLTLLFSLCYIRSIPYHNQSPLDGERLLVEDQASPVGYKVPSLPDFEIDPSMADTGSKCLSLNVEFLVGVIMALGVGIFLISLTFTTWQNHFW